MHDTIVTEIIKIFLILGIATYTFQRILSLTQSDASIQLASNLAGTVCLEHSHAIK